MPKTFTPNEVRKNLYRQLACQPLRFHDEPSRENIHLATDEHGCEEPDLFIYSSLSLEARNKRLDQLFRAGSAARERLLEIWAGTQLEGPAS